MAERSILVEADELPEAVGGHIPATPEALPAVDRVVLRGGGEDQLHIVASLDLLAGDAELVGHGDDDKFLQSEDRVEDNADVVAGVLCGGHGTMLHGISARATGSFTRSRTLLGECEVSDEELSEDHQSYCSEQQLKGGPPTDPQPAVCSLEHQLSRIELLDAGLDALGHLGSARTVGMASPVILSVGGRLALELILIVEPEDEPRGKLDPAASRESVLSHGSLGLRADGLLETSEERDGVLVESVALEVAAAAVVVDPLFLEDTPGDELLSRIRG